MTTQDQRLLLSSIARHLSPQGKFIFDTRNPARAAWKGWTREGTLDQFQHSRLGPVGTWTTTSFDHDTAIATYLTHYQILATGKTMTAASKIKFTQKTALENMIAECGLRVEHWYGDWTGTLGDEGSADHIPFGSLGP